MPTVTHGRPRTGQSRAVSAPEVSDRRRRFERASAPWVVRMSALPAFLIPIIMGTMLFFGLVLKAQWAGLLMVAIALFLGWLGALSWPQLSPGTRLLRSVVIAAVGVFGLVKLFGLI